MCCRALKINWGSSLLCDTLAPEQFFSWGFSVMSPLPYCHPWWSAPSPSLSYVTPWLDRHQCIICCHGNSMLRSMVQISPTVTSVVLRGESNCPKHLPETAPPTYCKWDCKQESRAVTRRTARCISIRVEFYNGIVRAVSLPQHSFLVGLCLQTVVLLSVRK